MRTIKLLFSLSGLAYVGVDELRGSAVLQTLCSWRGVHNGIPLCHAHLPLCCEITPILTEEAAGKMEDIGFDTIRKSERYVQMHFMSMHYLIRAIRTVRNTDFECYGSKIKSYIEDS